ncbi:uncharacterized protein FOMMEDRAFT_169881 [Fomitiporia mediterranea MF3/22]|uniref:uncharacterized protein n=1 Tax=Fomitiporia mediterranea (strain MF3/22) TaxID=694068 RepID=UPI0004409716|nr:uncharacterized protein FOMMEDRAFT_169881 [Fomitiporia mediterranea MF3/22]EJD00414.1 hypothetical protein FOMMEDRAFT_169881 [Fomitiporia mediterranea MF3/22]
MPSGRLLVVFVAISLFLSVRAVSNKVLNVSFPSTPPDTSRNIVHDNFFGISWELYPLNYLWGESPDAMPSAMKNYLSNIRARMSTPLRIRIGGNSMDGSQYVPGQKNMITITDENANFNDVPVDFGPVLFDVLNAMADTVGEMQFILGLSMRNPDADDNVIELAAASWQKLGNRLDALLLGNEPDLYAGHGDIQGYTIQQYILDVGDVYNDLGNSVYGNLTNTTIIGGPTICCAWPLDDVLNAGLIKFPYKYFTIQHYPTHVCGGSTAASSNITYYISHVNVSPFLRWNDEGIELAREAGVPMLLTEYNSASCGGDPSVAPTFAACLWAIDTALQGAALNFTGMYLHTREIGVTYNLFEPPSKDASLDSNWHTGANYYSLLVLAESISNSTSIVVDLNIDNSTTNNASSVAAYGIYDGDARNRSKLVFFNYDYPRAGGNSSDAIQSFVIPANLTSTVGVRYLLAANITEQTAISWANQTVGENGVLQGTQTMEIVNCTEGCSVKVPGPGLAVVWLEPQSELQSSSIYSGNSTVAGDSPVSHTTSGSIVTRRYNLHLVFGVVFTIVIGLAF